MTALISTGGMTETSAAKSTRFVQDMHTYLRQHPETWDALKYRETIKDGWEVYKNFKNAELTGRLARNAKEMSSSVAAPLASKATGASIRFARSGGVFALSAFVDIFSGYAKAHDIPLNECALAVSKVSLDLAGGLLAGPEIAIASLSTGVNLISIGRDGAELGTACFTK
jgi:hypothetical protein